MKLQGKQKSAFTLIELLVVITIIAILATFAVPGAMNAVNRARLLAVVNSGQNIHKAAFMMAQEAAIKQSTNYGWPGELKDNGKISDISTYVNQLVRYGFLPVGSLKIFATPGFIAYSGEVSGRGSNTQLNPPFNATTNCGFKIYLARELDDDNTLLLATKNYTYWQPLDPRRQPFGDKGFVVIRKDGSGAALNDAETEDDIVGILPGQRRPGEGSEGGDNVMVSYGAASTPRVSDSGTLQR